MKKIFLAIIYVGIHICVYAQNSSDDVFKEYKLLIDDVFSDIQPSKISTGILIERSVPLLNISEYNGEELSSSCNAGNWLNIYNQIYLGHLDLSSFNYDPSLVSIYPKTVDDFEIQLGIIFFDYNKINENAINDGLIILDSVNSKVKDVSVGNTIPFDVATCFASALLTNEINVGSYSIHINKSLFKSNKVTDFNALYIDFDDGNGYIQTHIGQTVYVNYFQSGQKKIRIKAIADSKIFYCNCIIDVYEEIHPKSLSGAHPDFGPYEYDYAGLKAEYGIYFRCDNSDNKIRKPYLIVSGFDPSDMNRIEDEIIKKQINILDIIKREEISKINLYTVANKNGYLDALRNNGYDIIIYRSKESTKSIVSNAMNLIGFIQKINDEISSENELIIAGASMGGQIVRYALTYMEHQSIDHKTKLFISVDSPHEGANVPLGFQYMASSLNAELLPYFPVVSQLKNAVDGLNSDAAQEMLLYHHKFTDNRKARCSTKRNEYISTLQSIGDFPKNCRNIGVSLGSGIGNSQGFNPGQLLLKKNPSIFAGDIISGGSNLRFEFEVHAVPNKSSCSIYTETLSIQPIIPVLVPCVCNPPFFTKLTYVPLAYIELNKKDVIVDNTESLDNAPGSYRNLHNTLDFTGDYEIFGSNINTVLSFLGDIDYDPNPDCFIPSYSALGLNSITDPHTNIKSYLNTQPNVHKINDNVYMNTGGYGISYFDALYIENGNDYHIYDDNEQGVFSQELLNVMTEEASPDNLFIENRTVTSGKSIAYEAKNSITTGADVNGATYDNGDVFVENGGKLLLSTNGRIIFKPGFKAQKGSFVVTKLYAPGYCSSDQVASKSGKIDGNSTSSYENLNIEQVESQKSNDLFDIVEEYSKPVILYPNPLKDKLYVSSNKEHNELYIYKLTGEMVHSTQFDRNTEIDMLNVQSGIYIVKVIQGNGSIFTERVIKE